jgi:hypothetical protein
VRALARGPGESCGNRQGGWGGSPSANSLLDFARDFTGYCGGISQVSCSGLPRQEGLSGECLLNARRKSMFAYIPGYFTSTEGYS